MLAGRTGSSGVRRRGTCDSKLAVLRTNACCVRRSQGQVLFFLLFTAMPIAVCDFAPAFQVAASLHLRPHSEARRLLTGRRAAAAASHASSDSRRPVLQSALRMVDEGGFLIMPNEHSGTSPPESFERSLHGLESSYDAGSLRFHDLLEGLNERLDAMTLLEFERNGHVAIKSLLDKSQTELLQKNVESAFHRHKFDAYIQKLRLLGEDAEDEELKQAAACVRSEEEAKALLDEWSEENDCPIPFLQVFNPHRGSTEEARALSQVVLSPLLGHIAADLLGVRGVRLYQSAVFHKAPGNGETSWHADLATAPFDSNDMVTCWVALTHVTRPAHSPLEFASGSHRDLALPYWYTKEGMENPGGDPREYDVESHLPLQPGDSTWHHGWVYHSAPPNESDQVRVALALSFVAQDAHLLPRKRCRRRPEMEDMESYSEWIEEVKPGAPAAHPLLPVTFSRPPAASRAEDEGDGSTESSIS